MGSPLSRRRFLSLSAASLMLAACGNNAGTATAPTAGSGAAGGAAPAELEFWDWALEGDRKAYMDQVIADWQAANPGTTIKYNPLGYGDMEVKLLTAASAGNNPPFSNVHAFWRVELQRSGVLRPYPADLFDYDNLWSTPFNRTADGQLYTSNFSLYTDQIYYNKALLEAEGITPDQIPRRWDDFIKMAQQLTKTENGQIVQSGWNFNHYYSREWLWATMVYQQGGFLYSEDGTQALWNSDEGIAALQLIQDVYHTHKLDDLNGLDMFEGFGNGTAATYISQGYTGGGIDAGYPAMAGNWGTAVTPTFTGNPLPAWGLVTPEEGFCVFTNAPEPAVPLAFSFIKEMLDSDERRVEWAIVSNGVPDSKTAAESASLKEREKGGNSISTQAETLPYRINYGERPLEAEQIWRTMFDQALLEKRPPREVLDAATEQMNAALAGSGKQRIFTERNYTPPSA
jgi:multiple sugar transport system substrate-binding protein